MAVAYDSSSIALASTSSPLTWTHTPVGTPGHVVVGVCCLESDSDQITAVTYGGVAMTAVTGGLAQDSAGEPCLIKLYELFSGIPTGAQTVSVSFSGSDSWIAGCISSTVASPAAVYEAGIVLLQGDGTLAEQSVTDDSPGTNSTRYAFLATGLNTLPSAGSNSTVIQSSDEGLNGFSVVRENTAGQGSRSIGWSSGSTDDRAGVFFAVAEAVSDPPNGDADITESPDTLSATATVAIAAAVSKSEAADTLSAVIGGNVAQLSKAEAADTLSAAAGVGLVGSAEPIEEADSLVSAATAAIVANLIKTEAADGFAGLFNPPQELDLDKSEAADTLLASGSVYQPGSLLRIRLIQSRLM